MTFRTLSLVAMIVIIPTLLAAQPFECTVKMPSPKNNRYPTELRINLDESRGFASVSDNVAARPNARPVRAEIIKHTEKVLTVKWELQGLKPSKIRNSSVTYGQRARYRGTIDKTNGSLVLSVQTNPWRPPDRTTGTCRTARS